MINMINLAEAIDNSCKIARQDERRKFKEYLEKKRNSIIQTNYLSAIGQLTLIDEIIAELFPNN